MSSLKWVLGYLFDCVHRHTTWPRRDRSGFAYVCCLDCGRELPYSLERMRLVTREDRNRKTRGARSAVAASLLLISALSLFNSGVALADTLRHSGDQAQNAGLTRGKARPILVIGFVGGFVHSDDVRHSEVQLARHLQAICGDHVEVKVFKNRQTEQAHKVIVEWFNSLSDTAPAAPEEGPKPRIILFGHSWGASAVVYLARELDRDSISIALTIQVDSVRKNGQDDSIIPANVAEAVNFYQSKGLIHGRARIMAADSSRTTILGNFHFNYQEEPTECRAYPWYDRAFFKGHTSIECDPHVWSEVETLIEKRLSPFQATQTEVAAALQK